MPTRETCPNMLPDNVEVHGITLRAIFNPDGVGGYRRPSLAGGEASLFVVTADISHQNSTENWVRRGCWLADFADPNHAEDFCGRLAGRYFAHLDDKQFRDVLYGGAGSTPYIATTTVHKTSAVGQSTFEDPWIEWTGGPLSILGLPMGMDPLTKVLTVLRCGSGIYDGEPREANKWVWRHGNDGGDIVAYRIADEVPAIDHAAVQAAKDFANQLVEQPMNKTALNKCYGADTCTCTGHPHSDLMAMYAEDAARNREPWKLWQCRHEHVDEWSELETHPGWGEIIRYRRKPVPVPTRVINGFTVPAPLTEVLEDGDEYWLAATECLEWACFCEWSGDHEDLLWLERGLAFLDKDHAIANAKAMCGVDPEWSQS